MRIHYNVIAGQSVELLAALSDGVFAVTMTTLVLDLKVPAAEAIHGERALLILASRLLVYLMSSCFDESHQAFGRASRMAA